MRGNARKAGKGRSAERFSKGAWSKGSLLLAPCSLLCAPCFYFCRAGTSSHPVHMALKWAVREWPVVVM